MRGRHPSGPEFVDKLQGLPEAKLRLKVVLETLDGSCRIQEACEQLGIKEARFDQLRIKLLQAAVNAAERRPAGRPARESSPAEEEIRQLQERIAQLEADLQATLIRAELAVTLPNVGASAEKNDSEPPSDPPSAGTTAATDGIVVNHLKHMIPSHPVAEGPPRRGFAGQRVQREQEQVVRRHVVDFSQRLVEKGWNWNETADLLGLAPHLRDWRLDFKLNQLRAVPLGRPILDATRTSSNSSFATLTRRARALAWPPCDPSSPRCLAANSTTSCTAIAGSGANAIDDRSRSCTGRSPAPVWAIDFHGPPLIDGLHPHLLAVRDLATGHILLWLPVGDVTADTVVRAHDRPAHPPRRAGFEKR